VGRLRGERVSDELEEPSAFVLMMSRRRPTLVSAHDGSVVLVGQLAVAAAANWP
jgi:hypothetical protein